MKSAVEIENLSYSYGKRVALNDITFSCQYGQLMGILGPNGSGKSTLMRILATLILPKSGKGEVCGFDLLQQPKSIRRIIGVVFQSPSFDKRLTVQENLFNHGHFYGLYGNSLRQRVEYLLSELQLGDRTHELLETLSGGLQRRVELAKGLLNNPKLLLMDEPTSGLDLAARIEFWNLIERIRQQENSTIIFSTHLIEEADTCDLLTVLENGSLVASDSPESLKEIVAKEVIKIISDNNKELAAEILKLHNVKVENRNGSLRIESDNGVKLLAEIVTEYKGKIHYVRSSKSTLEDVFFSLTGKDFSKGV